MNTNILQTLVTAMQRRLAALPQRLRPFTTEFDELPKNLMLTGARGLGDVYKRQNRCQRMWQIYISTPSFTRQALIILFC